MNTVTMPLLQATYIEASASWACKQHSAARVKWNRIASELGCGGRVKGVLVAATHACCTYLRHEIDATDGMAHRKVVVNGGPDDGRVTDVAAQPGLAMHRGPSGHRLGCGRLLEADVARTHTTAWVVGRVDRELVARRWCRGVS